MNETVRRAPFVHGSEDTRARMRDVLIALAPSLLAAVWFYGLQALLMALCGVAAAGVCELLIQLILRRGIRLSDGSFAVTGLLCAMLLPAQSAFWLPALAALAAIVCKETFGGLGRNWLNPALTGAVLCYAVGFAPLTGPVTQLMLGGFPTRPWLLLIGAASGGAIGACSPLLLLLGYGYLSARGLTRPAFSLTLLLVLLLGSCSTLPGGVLHLFCSGEALLLVLFCGSDSVTTPILVRSQLILGPLLGAAAVALRLPGIEGAAPALLLAGPVARGLDALLLRNS